MNVLQKTGRKQEAPFRVNERNGDFATVGPQTNPR
jgi:hypothetical protein